MSKEEPYYYLAPVDDDGKEGEEFCSVDFSLEPEATPERAVRELVEEARMDAIKRHNGAESGEARYRIVDRNSGLVKDFKICWRAEAIDEPESDSAKVDRLSSDYHRINCEVDEILRRMLYEKHQELMEEFASLPEKKQKRMLRKHLKEARK